MAVVESFDVFALQPELKWKESLMGTYSLQQFETVRDLAQAVATSSEPAVIYDGEDECLVVMRPAVFDRILFDTGILNLSNRESLHL